MYNAIYKEKYVTRIMRYLGVPANLKGYYYLREAILLSERDMEVVGNVTKLLYPEIAKKYQTTNQRVERAIRNAIEVSWQRGNTDILMELFGYCAAYGRKRPTNSEYIARLADQVRLDLQLEETLDSLRSYNDIENRQTGMYRLRKC